MEQIGSRCVTRLSAVCLRLRFHIATPDVMFLLGFVVDWRARAVCKTRYEWQSGTGKT